MIMCEGWIWSWWLGETLWWYSGAAPTTVTIFTFIIVIDQPSQTQQSTRNCKIIVLLLAQMFWSYSRSFFKEYLNLIILGGLQYMKQFLICCLNNPTFIVSAAATHFICIAWLELIYQSKKIDSSGGISRTTVYISIHDYIIHIHFNSRHCIRLQMWLIKFCFSLNSESSSFLILDDQDHLERDV